MEEPKAIFRDILEWGSLMGCNCKKLLGAATAQTIRMHLIKHGFNVSQRNVYIKGIPNEFDLLLLKRGVSNHMLIYPPDEILAVFEVKFRGSFGRPTIDGLIDVCKKIKDANRKISCLYITVLEGKTYKNKVTYANSGWNTFEMFYYKGDIVTGPKEDTKDWYKLLKYIKKIVSHN
jgi:hypothetical protein